MSHALAAASPATEKIDRDVISEGTPQPIATSDPAYAQGDCAPQNIAAVDWPHNHCSQFGLLGPEPQRQTTASQSKNPRPKVADHLRRYSGSGVKALGITGALD